MRLRGDVDVLPAYDSKEAETRRHRIGRASMPRRLLGAALLWLSANKHRCFPALGCAALFLGGLRYRQVHYGANPRRFDAVVVPGGGLEPDGRPAPWVQARLDAALAHDKNTDYFLVLSRGTTHKPPPLDERGFPLDESAASGAYLQERGVDASRILLESWSLDTIGNAAFTRLMHADVRRWRRLLVITNAFHAARTREIFEWVFSLPPHSTRKPALLYEVVSEVGIDEAALEGRAGKEQRALELLRSETIPAVPDLVALHGFLFQRHGAYRAAARSAPPAAASRDALATY